MSEAPIEPLQSGDGGAAATRLSRLLAGGRPQLMDQVFLLGLAGVFLANAAIAVVDPEAFTALVAAGPLDGLIGVTLGSWLVPAIAVNDFAIGVAILAARRVQRLRTPTLAWAGAWLMIVTSTKLTAML